MSEVANGVLITHKFSDIQTNPTNTRPPIPNPYIKIQISATLYPLFTSTISVPPIRDMQFPNNTIGLRP